ncbi:MAG: 4-hydroxy-3-methylbut-2-enyl diphosphate reductase [Isosphaeraceae bacterium]
MNVIRADVLGMCFGVRDALKVIASVDAPETVTIHGQLVHNEVVLDDLHTRGFRMLDEKERAVDRVSTPAVLITAHGISDRERERLRVADRTVIDTTCPLVRRAHLAAKTLQSEGYHVLIIGTRGHVEVQGIVEDLTSCEVVGSLDEVRSYEGPRLGVIAQTTTPVARAAEIVRAIEQHNPHCEVRFVDTICQPTKDHQRSLDRLLESVQAMVVVGGSNSNNTRALTEKCRAYGCPVIQVASAEELDLDFLAGFERVGLTAGTSTLDRTIDEVEHALKRHRPERLPVSSEGKVVAE